ncbi:hypothetical protein RM555_22595 [Micromonospora sp. DSM 115977]|uniref:Uncharacterized protein n=1 Tax=Micromonospora reichwaldensis TaxID=3075516 RepID=A0ABU2X2X9_9ACTN|nr:hypothetical protein [Micromonospora sp. DSM 115977]MDT0531784.1 hypothetical protein [Micromonospora sp. DSM 115977]
MRIDDGVEQRLRAVLHHVVKQQSEEFDIALRAFPDDRSRRDALELLVAITYYALIDAYGRRPSPEEVHEVAASVAESERWVPLSHSEVERYLNQVLGGQPLTDVLEPEAAVLLAFVVTGSLLSSRPQGEGEWWFNYLDKVEAAIEAAG